MTSARAPKMSVPECPINTVGTGNREQARFPRPAVGSGWPCFLSSLLGPCPGPRSSALPQAPAQITSSTCLDNLSRESFHLTFKLFFSFIHSFFSQRTPSRDTDRKP